MEKVIVDHCEDRKLISQLMFRMISRANPPLFKEGISF